jgi:hypothetical protein
LIHKQLYFTFSIFSDNWIACDNNHSSCSCHKCSNGNTSFITDNNGANNKSELTNSKNSLLKQLGLYIVSQRLNDTISNLTDIAEASMNASNSFGKLPQVNLTNDMKIKYHRVRSDQELEKRIEAKQLLANNNALLYVGLLCHMEIAILVGHISHIKLIALFLIQNLVSCLSSSSSPKINGT